MGGGEGGKRGRHQHFAIFLVICFYFVFINIFLVSLLFHLHCLLLMHSLVIPHHLVAVFTLIQFTRLTPTCSPSVPLIRSMPPIIVRNTSSLSTAVPQREAPYICSCYLRSICLSMSLSLLLLIPTNTQVCIVYMHMTTCAFPTRSMPSTNVCSCPSIFPLDRKRSNLSRGQPSTNACVIAPKPRNVNLAPFTTSISMFCSPGSPRA